VIQLVSELVNELESTVVERMSELSLGV